jgi:cytochrome P450 family 6
VRIRGRDQWEQIFNISHIPKHRLFFPSYFTSLLSVSMFTETLRKFPIISFLERKFCSDFELSATTGNRTITLPAGTGVYIPVFALHYGPTYFQPPQKFDPDRFTKENKYSRPNYTYLPFGEGPRMCIGKDRHLIFPHKNFRFRLLRIFIVLLLPRRLSVW